MSLSKRQKCTAIALAGVALIFGSLRLYGLKNKILAKEPPPTSLKINSELSETLKLKFKSARLLEREAKYSEAKLEYERLLNMCDEPDIHFAYGVLLSKMNYHDKAIRHLQKAHELYPEGSDSKRAVETAIGRLKGKK